MSEEDVRRYLGRAPKDIAPPPQRPPARKKSADEASFKDFSATHLLCPKCKTAMPVRQRLMLFLPDGDLYDYSCTKCGTSCGTRKGSR